MAEVVVVSALVALAIGITGIITDFPQRVVSALQSRIGAPT